MIPNQRHHSHCNTNEPSPAEPSSRTNAKRKTMTRANFTIAVLIITCMGLNLLQLVYFSRTLQTSTFNNIIQSDNSSPHNVEASFSPRPRPRPRLRAPHTQTETLAEQTDVVRISSSFSTWRSHDDRINDLEQSSALHGTFFFAPTTSHENENEIISSQPSWTPLQKELLDDEEITDVEHEKKRCRRYNFGDPTRQTLARRRRLFLGALIADESFDVLQAVGTEVYNLFHTVSLIESNATHNLSPRKWRFGMGSDNLHTLQQLFGPKTRVSVDYYVSNLTTRAEINNDDMITDYLQREGNNLRWAMNGMRPDDIAIVGDCDETFSRDFLRALQVCDVREFRKGQKCNDGKILASTLVFESSPECIAKDRRWYHPDAILGECVDQIGDVSLHPPTKREWKNVHGNQIAGYGENLDYSSYDSDNLGSGTGNYPLWFATDIRLQPGTEVAGKDGSATGYHFHNYFESAKEIHWKYLTYGHAHGSGGDRPIWEVHQDIELGVQCARGVKNDNWIDFTMGENGSSNMPIYYLNEKVRNAKHRHWQDIVQEDGEYFNRTEKDATWIFHPPPTNT